MASDFYLYFEGGFAIAGSTTDAEFKPKKAVEIHTFSFGSSNPVTIGSKGITGGKVNLSSVNVMKTFDESSPALFTAVNTSADIDKAFIVFRRAAGDPGKGGVTYLRFELEKPRITSVQWSASAGGDDYPTESVTIEFAKITMHYSPSDDTGKAVVAGNVSTGWDLLENKKI